MDERVIESNPTPLMEAMEENLHGHVAFLQRQLPGMSVVDEGGLLVVDSGLPTDTFNKILAARLDEDGADRRIEEALSYFRESGRPFSWWVGPCSRPLDLEERLRRFGMNAQEYEVGMTMALEAMPDTLELAEGASITRVATREDLERFADLLAKLGSPPDASLRAFFERAETILLQDDCPMRFFLASVKGEPAAVSELFLGGGLAGVHMVATREKFRRRGLGMALTWAALDEGRRAGVRMGALQAVLTARSVYERLGFEACGRFVEYSLP